MMKLNKKLKKKLKKKLIRKIMKKLKKNAAGIALNNHPIKLNSDYTITIDLLKK